MKRWFLLKANGQLSEVTASAKPKSLDWLYSQVGEPVEHVQLDGRTEIWCNENGKLIGLPMNVVASAIWLGYFGPTDVLVGDVLLAMWGKPTALHRLLLQDLEGKISHA